MGRYLEVEPVGSKWVSMTGWGWDPPPRPHNGISVSRRRRRRSQSSVSAKRRYGEKAASASQEEGSHQELNMLGPWALTSQPAELWKINSCCLSPSVYGILLQQPELTKTLGDNNVSYEDSSSWPWRAGRLHLYSFQEFDSLLKLVREGVCRRQIFQDSLRGKGEWWGACYEPRFLGLRLMRKLKTFLRVADERHFRGCDDCLSAETKCLDPG